jgi:hypothetical protein
MRKSFRLLLLCALTAALGLAGAAQTPAAAPRNRIIGVVSAADEASSSLTVKLDAGEVYKVSMVATTKLLRLAPGETQLSKAQPIQFNDISVGDRVLAQGPLNDAEKTIEALRVIDMSQADLAKKHQQEQADWQHRSVAGTAAVKDEPNGMLTLRLPAMMADGELVKVAVSNRTVYKRYSPDSVKYADAKPSTLAEIGTGDQVRVLGNKDDAGTVQAEQVVSGSFITLAATVVSVDAAAGLVQAKNMQNGKPLTIKITADSNLRRVPPMGGGAAGGGQQRPAGAASGAPPAVAQAGPGNGAQGGAPGGGQRRGGDFSRLMEFMPKIAVDGLKTGETIVVASSKGGKPDEVTAVTLLAGADFLVTMAQARGAQGGRPGAANGPSMGMNLDVMSMVPAQ